jgi:hypothetical protein
VIGRLATGLKKLPSEILDQMTFSEANELFGYWQDSPPEHDLVAMLARVYTTWGKSTRPMTEAEHRASLEARWNSGAAMNPKQIFEAMGGKMRPGAVVSSDGVMPGIGRFPGAH